MGSDFAMVKLEPKSGGPAEHQAGMFPIDGHTEQPIRTYRAVQLGIGIIRYQD